MAMGDIKKIVNAEQEACDIIAAAVEKAKTTLSDAERKGQLTFDIKIAEANEKAKAIIETANANATAINTKHAKSAALRCDAIRKSAVSKLDEAAELICERVVRG